MSENHNGEATEHVDVDTEKRKIFVGGLSWETTAESLKQYFSTFGEVSDSVIMKHPQSGHSRGFGFITFANMSGLETALAQKSHTLDKKTIDPKRAVPRSEQKEPALKTKKIFVGGLSPNTNEESLKSFFSQFGSVVDATLMTDRETSRPRGFGFVTFDSEATVDTICEKNFYEIDGKSVEIKKAEPKVPRPRRDEEFDPYGSGSYYGYDSYGAGYAAPMGRGGFGGPSPYGRPGRGPAAGAYGGGYYGNGYGSGPAAGYPPAAGSSYGGPSRASAPYYGAAAAGAGYEDYGASAGYDYADYGAPGPAAAAARPYAQGSRQSGYPSPAAGGANRSMRSYRPY